VWRFLKKLEIELSYDPAILLLGIHTEETRIERDTCTPVFIAALFTIARAWQQPRCPSADEWIRLFAALCTVARQAPLSWGSPGENTGVGCQFLLWGNLPDPEMEPASVMPPVLAGKFFTTLPSGKPPPSA